MTQGLVTLLEKLKVVSKNVSTFTYCAPVNGNYLFSATFSDGSYSKVVYLKQGESINNFNFNIFSDSKTEYDFKAAVSRIS